MIDISYRIFDLVVSTNSLTKTAEIVHLTPSAVSHSLRKLEQTLGMRLVIRGRDGVKLTQAGRELLPHVRYTMKAEERLQQEVSRITGSRAGELHVGVFSSVGCNWMPEIMRRMERDYPQIELHIHQYGYAGLEDGVANGELDTAFVSLPVSETVPTYPLLRDRLLCITPKGFETVNEGYITIEEMRDQTMILPHTQSDYDARAFMEANGMSADTPHELADDALIISMVESGHGISVIPELVLAYLGGDINIYPIESAPFRHIGLATQRNEYVTPATKLFVRTVLDYVNEQYPEDQPYFR